MEKILLLVSKEKRRRYRNKKFVKYGNINKGFTDEELTKFFACCRNPKAKLAFWLMANLGFRIGEVVQIRAQDIDFSRRKLTVQTEKAHTSDSLYLHDEVYERLKDWLDARYTEITGHEGYLFYSDSPCNDEWHISSHWLRAEFRDTCILAGFNDTYARSEESINRTPRTLHRLTTHSLRHYFITRVYKTLKDPIVAQKLARHQDIKSTQVYIHTAQNDLDGSLSKVFERNFSDQQKDQDDLKKLIQVWGIIR